jgi:hypothetical protein
VFFLEWQDHIDAWRVLHTRRDIPERMRDTDTPRAFNLNSRPSHSP